MTFWKPGTVAPGSDELIPIKSSTFDRETEKEISSGSDIILSQFSTQKLSIQQQRVRLPIYQNSM